MKSICHNSPILHYHNGSYCSVCFAQQFKRPNRIPLLAFSLFILLIVFVQPTKAPSLDRITGRYILSGAGIMDMVPNDTTVLEELVKNKCVLASVAVAQARIESGNYTSDIAVNNKNLFGIKVHDCQYVTGERKGHATFASYRDNIACYCHIQHRYLKKIDRTYAEDTLYCQLIKRMK